MLELKAFIKKPTVIHNEDFVNYTSFFIIIYFISLATIFSLFNFKLTPF